MKTNDKTVFIPAAQLVRAHRVSLDFEPQYMTQDHDGVIYLWDKKSWPYASTTIRRWMPEPTDVYPRYWTLGRFNVLEFHGRRWDNRILDLREVRNDWDLPKPKPRNVKNKNNYQWTKGK